MLILEEERSQFSLSFHIKKLEKKKRVVRACVCCHVQLSAAVAGRALSVGFSQQESWSRCHPFQGIFLIQRSNLRLLCLPALQSLYH